KILADTVAANRLGNVVLVQKALGNKVGKVKFWVSGSGSSLQPFTHGAGEIEIEVTTVDEYVESTGHAPQILKVDVEGFELYLIAGAERTLAQCRVVCCEVHPAKMRAAGCEPEQLFDLLARKGFERVCEYLPLKHQLDPGRAYNLVFERTKF